MLSERRGYPDSQSLVAGHHSRKKSLSRPSGRLICISYQVDTKSLAQPACVVLFGNDPFARVRHDVCKLQQARRSRIQTYDPVHTTKSTIVAPGTLQLCVEGGVFVMLIHIGNDVHVRNAVAT